MSTLTTHRASHPPLIIEAALNGITPQSRNPNVPTSPDQIARTALACLAAGASLIHSHIDDYNITGAVATARYMEGWLPILAARPDAILCATVATGQTPQQRFDHFRELASHGMRMGVLDPGSVNLATHGPDGLPGAHQFVYATSFADIAYLIDLMTVTGLGPSISIYEPGFLRTTLAYYRAGKLPKGALIKFYFGGPYNMIDGKRSNVTFGLPPTATALSAYLEMMQGCDLPWMVTVIGGDVTAEGLTRLAIERGGHVRVGLEDYAGSRCPRNEEIVAEVVAIARDCRRAIATPAQAAEYLKLPNASQQPDPIASRGSSPIFTEQVEL